MIQVIKKAAYKYGYLAITAAWLYTISFVFTNYWSLSSTPQRVKLALEDNIAKEESKINSLLQHGAGLQQLVNNKPAALKEELTKEDYGLFVYEVNNQNNPFEIYWNSYRMSLEMPDVKYNDATYTVNYQNGLFEIIRRAVYLDSNKYIFIALVPLHWNYFLENKYLRSEFAGLPNIENLYRITNNPRGISIKNSAGNILFYIEKKYSSAVNHPDIPSILLRIVAVILFMIFINAIATSLVEKVGYIKGVFFLIASIALFRALTYGFSFPFDYRRLELFDPAVYASNTIHQSLGDLLVNTLLFSWIVIFIKFSKPEVWTKKYKFSAAYVVIAAIAGILLFAFTTLEIADIIASLVKDSQISFDVTNFFGLSIYTAVSFFILCVLLLAYYHLSPLLLLPAKEARIDIFWHLIIAFAASLIFLNLLDTDIPIEIKIATAAWMIFYMLLLEYRSQERYSYILQSSFFLFWLLFFSGSASLLMVSQNRFLELEIRKKTAEKLASQTDPAGENLINVAIGNLSNSFLLKNYEQLKPDSNTYIKDSLISINFSGYLNKYDTRIYTYDSSYVPYNDDIASYNVIQAINNNRYTQAKGTSIPNLYYYENAADKFSYLYTQEIKKQNETIGHLVIILKPKKYKSDALYPELFKQATDVQADLNQNYAFAVYNRDHLINRFNNYPFPDTLIKTQVPMYDYLLIKRLRYNELWYRANEDKVVIVARKNTWLIDFITLFSYLFCTFVGIVLLLSFGRFIIKSRFSWQVIRQLFRVSIRMQIQTTIIFISLFSFIIIGVATISFFINRFNRNNEEKLSQSMQLMVNEVQESLKQPALLNNPVSFNEFGYFGNFDRKVLDISNIHNTDVNFYDINGNLIVSTQPYIYNKQVLSQKINAAAFYQLYYLHKTELLQKENIGDFSYLSIYAPVKGEDGNPVAFLNIPYFNSQNELNSEISNFLVTLVNLNAFIFVLAGAIAVALTNRITASFDLISNKMKMINLGEKNEIITWERNDEIGVLVDEYNKMVLKLDQSAQSLAKSEREGAWQEMARQVAHEIKNPLTPMKLSIQYLQRAISNDTADVKKLSAQVAATLVEQIDQLSRIAGDFAQFANIEYVEPVQFDVTDVLQSLVSLYNSGDHVQISLHKNDDAYIITSDKVQINRLFTNLIKNAIEASPEEAVAEISITLEKQDGLVIIAVQDKGAGIPLPMRHKIFNPNFTTKSSGTGLGLAICKGIVQKANGKIWFQTITNEGTAFYVALPLSET